jgi:ATP-dependent Clp protease protease subunit
LAKHTGQTVERVHIDTDRDFTLEAQAALDYGVIDEIITTRSLADRSGPIR